MQESAKSNLLLMLIEFSLGRVSYSEFKDRLECHGRDIFFGEDAYGQNIFTQLKEEISLEDLLYLQKTSLNVAMCENNLLTSEYLNIFILELLDNIKKVFNDVSIEGGTSLEEALAMDMRKYDTKSNSVQNSIHWSDLSYEQLREGLDSHYYCYLDQIGFRFYLPADMSFCLRFLINDLYSKEYEKTSYIEALIIALMGKTKREKDAYNLFSPEQKNCVKQFSHFVYLFVAQYDENKEFALLYEKI